MGTISDKLTYLNTTKSQLKDMINNGLPTGEQITSSTTFRNYVSSIFNAFLEALRNPDTLFTNLPKKSGTGANITLNDTANAPMRIELGASELSQDGTPTPSSPQDIHIISGSNKIVVNGKNLLDTSYLVEANADKTYNGYGFWAFKITEELDTFTFSRENGNVVSTANFLSIGTGSDLATAYNNKVWVMHPSISGLNQQSVKITNTGELWLFMGNSTEKIDNTITGAGYMQLEKGSTATTYEPYTSQEADIDLGDIEYCKIGNYEDKFIRTSGKNLFDKNTMVLNAYINTTGWALTSDANMRVAYAPCKPNTTYTVSKIQSARFAVASYSSITFGSTGANGISNNSATNITITTDANAKYLCVFYYHTSDTLSEQTIRDSIMIQKGNIENPQYEPYGSNEWYIKKNIGKIILNGSETWGGYAFGNYYRYSISINNIKMETSTNIQILSNYFYGNASALDSGNCLPGMMANSSNTTNVYFVSNETSISNFQLWLSTHNTDVYYLLATPTYTQITGTLAEQLENVYKNMLSQKGVTNISQVNNDLSFNLSVLAIEDLEV